MAASTSTADERGEPVVATPSLPAAVGIHDEPAARGCQAFWSTGCRNGTRVPPDYMFARGPI